MLASGYILSINLSHNTHTVQIPRPPQTHHIRVIYIRPVIQEELHHRGTSLLSGQKQGSHPILNKINLKNITMGS